MQLPNIADIVLHPYWSLLFVFVVFWLGRLFESHKAARQVWAKRRERFQDEQIRVSAELYAKMAECADAALHRLIIFSCGPREKSEFADSYVKQKSKELERSLQHVQALHYELRQYLLAHDLYFPRPLVDKIWHFYNHIFRPMAWASQAASQGVDRLEYHEHVEAQRVRRESMDLLDKLRDEFYDLLKYDPDRPRWWTGLRLLTLRVGVWFRDQYRKYREEVQGAASSPPEPL